MKIIRLPESWAARIAAGEVIERPASVVKELVENSLDAGAKDISVWVENAGVSLIRVSDDGEGIAGDDLALAVERHATSKIKDESDLWQIATLGFRGEALPSIGSVAKLEITSRTRQSEGGCRIMVEGGSAGESAAAGCAPGTTVEVRELFFNIPARRKFLKAPATELSHICDVVNHAALAHPEVHFRLYNQGKPVSDYPSGVEARDRLAQVFGRDIAGGMAPFSWTRGEIKVSGFLSKAPSSFPTTRYLTAYVNRRFVRDRVLTHAILHGYETLLMKGRYPAVVLYLDMPHRDVDVNVHPAKHEVRFRRQQEIHEAVADAVKEGLRVEAKAPTPLFLRRGAEPAPAVRESMESYSAPVFASGPTLTPREILEIENTPPLAGGGFFSSLEVLGQLLGCYLVCASPRGLAVIDQHAAHERIAFERMRREVADGAIERQNLLIPQVIELPAGEAALLEQRLDLLDRVGFAVERFGRAGEYVIRSAPALFPAGDYREAIRRMIAEIADIGASGELQDGLEERLATIACHSVIRAHRKLERDEILALLSDLDKIDFATQCPHGRPVVIELSEGQLEAMFRRT
ncbi:MAG TPA: DNA mismatch repair endonuclease MutL [Candidatus Binatia bacterium]|nr:DNA mismatch repair endonuclease MutL [Candidatus Binatia bacterium]